MSPSASSSTAVLVAGSALLAAAGLGYLATTRRSSGKKAWSAESSTVNNDDDNEITAAEVCEIYTRLLTALQTTCQDLVRQIAPYRPHLPSRELKVALATELERALRRHQHQILSEKDIDLECFDEAVRDLVEHNHTQVKQSVTKFQMFWRNCANELFPVVNSTVDLERNERVRKVA